MWASQLLSPFHLRFQCCHQNLPRFSHHHRLFCLLQLLFKRNPLMNQYQHRPPILPGFGASETSLSRLPSENNHWKTRVHKIPHSRQFSFVHFSRNRLLLGVELMSHHGRGSKPCTLCDITNLTFSVLSHVLLRHNDVLKVQPLPDEDVVLKKLECMDLSFLTNFIRFKLYNCN